ncbi:MAG: anaerobic sulfatase maturase [Asgard group archaeon]|nr:anaerobic sulfatase maturase [Asgard group archaeon]
MMNKQTQFQLLIKPASADCNLRCKYCFYLEHLDPAQKKTRMSDEVLNTLIAKYMETEQSNYTFIWQGGEPTLMGLEFFKKVVQIQQKYGRSGSIVTNVLQTNGILIDDELAAFFRQYNFLLGVSLDGPANIHDHYRKTIGNKPTQTQVLRGIETLRRNNVNFNILTMVTNYNVKKPVEIYHYLKNEGFNYHQYIPCVEFDQNNQLQHYSISGEEWGNFLINIFNEWMNGDTKTISIRLFDSILEYLVNGRVNACQMGVNCCKYLVVEYNGDIYPCDFFVKEELNLGNIIIDNWKDLLHSAKYSQFGEKKAQWNKLCQTCSFLDICHGDCQKNRWVKDGLSPKTLSVLCKGWKLFFTHSMPYFSDIAKKFLTDNLRIV